MDVLAQFLPTVFVLALGSAIGSFLNVVVYRIPAGLSILHPPSRCPHCLHRLRRHENVPVLGWLWLRGRCAHCGSPIAVRYPLVEALTGLLFVVTFWVFGFSWLTVGYWLFFSWLLALALIDVDTMTLPNPLTQSGLIAGLVFQGWLAIAQPGGASAIASQLMTGILGAVVGLWLLELIGNVGSLAFGRTAMGGGDAKLAAMMGAWLGWKLLLLAGFIACVLGALWGGGAQVLKVSQRGQVMPFGPFLALGALLTAFFGETAIAAYLRLFFPTL